MNKMFLIDYKWIPFVFIVTCTIFFFFFLLAMGGPLCLFTLALWGYWVALLPRALYSRLARFAHTRFVYMKIFKRKKCVSIDSKRSETHSNAKKSLPLWPITHLARSAKPKWRSLTSHSCSLRSLGLCARILLALLRVSRSWKFLKKCLNRLEMLWNARTNFTPLTHYASGEEQPYLTHVTPRVPRSFHSKFHADWTKTVSARGIHTQTYRQTVLF